MRRKPDLPALASVQFGGGDSGQAGCPEKALRQDMYLRTLFWRLTCHLATAGDPLPDGVWASELKAKKHLSAASSLQAAARKTGRHEGEKATVEKWLHCLKNKRRELSLVSIPADSVRRGGDRTGMPRLFPGHD